MAFSLFTIKDMFPREEAEYWINHVKDLKEPKYQKGYPLYMSFQDDLPAFLRELESHIDSLR